MKRLVACSLFVLLGLFLFAGGGQEGSTTQEGAVTLRAYILQDDIPTAEAAYEKFKESHPDITIEFLTQDYFAGEQAIVQLAGGADIDIIPTGNNAGYTDYVSKNLLTPMNDYVERDGIDVSGYGAYWTGREIDGVNYDLPLRGSTWVLYYNKDLFDAAGVEYPSQDMTWTEYRALAKQMTSGRGDEKIWGTYLHTWPVCIFGPALQTGTSIIDEDLSEVEKAIQLRLDMQNDGSTMAYADQIATKAHYLAMFMKGNVAMHVIGDWHIGQLRREADNVDFEWDIAPAPYPENGSKNTTWGMGNGLGIVSYSKKKDAAWEFIKAICGPEGQELTAERGFVPAYTSDATKAAYMKPLAEGLPPANLGIVLEQKIYMEYPAVENIQIIAGTIYKEEIELVLIEEQSPGEAIMNIKKRIAEEL